MCEVIGYRASECTAPKCYVCNQPVHYANACPQRQGAAPPCPRAFTSSRFTNQGRQSANTPNYLSGNGMGGGLLRTANPRLPSVNRMVIFKLNERDSVGNSSQREYGSYDRAQRHYMVHE